MECGKTILVVMAPLVATATVFADMTPLSLPSDASRFQTAMYDRPDLQPVRTDSGRLDGLAMWDSNAFSVGLLTEARVGAGQTGEPQTLCILSDRQDSFCLCLYALLSLGLWRSAPWAKKLPLGVIPGWYHYGGPFQVGHSFAISPDCLHPATICCLVQPDRGDQAHVPQYHRGTIVSLGRKSQFAPTVSAARGPPSVVLESYVA